MDKEDFNKITNKLYDKINKLINLANKNLLCYVELNIIKIYIKIKPSEGIEMYRKQFAIDLIDLQKHKTKTGTIYLCGCNKKQMGRAMSFVAKEYSDKELVKTRIPLMVDEDLYNFMKSCIHEHTADLPNLLMILKQKLTITFLIMMLTV